MRTLIASRAITTHPDINSTPLLFCEGKCRYITAHELSHLELSYPPFEGGKPSIILIYRCDTCNKPRHWGRIAWDHAIDLDPTLVPGLTS